MNTKAMGKEKFVTLGEVMLRLTPPGRLRLRQAECLNASFGGSEANVAASLASFGLDSLLVSRLPENDLGEACLHVLRAAGIDTTHIVRGGSRIGVYFLENGAAVRPPRVVYDRADSAFATMAPGLVDWRAVFAQAKWFHWSGIVPATSALAAEVCKEAIQTARQMGLTISCDLNYRKNLWRYGKRADEVMPEMVAMSDVVFGAMPEYRDALGIDEVPFKACDASYELDEAAFLQSCRDFMGRFPRCRKMFVELRNSLGVDHDILAAVLYADGVLRKAPIYDIDHVVDKVGVGDAFVGGMIYGITAYPTDDQKALEFALAASALKNTIVGDWNYVSASEVEALMSGDRSGRVRR